MASAASMEAAFWDKRYGQEDFVYGRQPNVFIQACEPKYLAPGGPKAIVELASGEGRNVAFLAQAGHTVTAVDFSQAGLQKTLDLVATCGAAGRVETACADVVTWQPKSGPGSVQAVVMSFCHIALEQKPAFFSNLTRMLAPGGLLLLETFRPDQILRGYREKSGGPHDPDMMFSIQELRQLLAACCPGEELEADEVDYDLHEGAFHEGRGAVVRYVWRKA